MSVVRNSRRRIFAAPINLLEFSKFFDGIAVALARRGDKSNGNDQTTLQARTTTTQGWSSI
jgi:hypothetical protein